VNKVCKTCGIEKDVSYFYKNGTLSNGANRIHPSCKLCVLEYGRKMYANNEEYKIKRKIRAKKCSEDPIKKAESKERSSSFYKSISGRAKTLYKGACRRSEQYENFDITCDWIEDKLKIGFCEITGFSFDFSPHNRYSKNPYSPSIDRIDSTKGYTKDNVRIVLWQVNLMRGEMNDDEILLICEKFIEGVRNKQK